MPDLTPEDFRPNVEKGARWLEEQGAWDWPDKILAAAAVGEFDMGGCSSCAVGVTLGNYMRYCGKAWGSEEARALGFEQPALDITRDHPDDYYRVMEQAWIDYAREEQAARA